MEKKQRLLVLASGTRDGGGSGGEKLVEHDRLGNLAGTVVGFASNHEHGGVRVRADRLGVPFHHLSKEKRTPQGYRELVEETNADFVALSGWLLPVTGLNPCTTFNIHPGPLPVFGGEGMHGHHVHEAVLAAYRRGEITNSAVTMHFVNEQYDDGPVFFRYPVPIKPDDTPKTLGKRVNEAEHFWQYQITNLVLTRKVHWNGENRKSLVIDLF